jgi:hypothetical protein
MASYGRGTFVGQQRTALPGEDNHGFIDRYTAGHAAFGVLGGLARLPWWGMLASGLAWDLVIERRFKDLWKKRAYFTKPSVKKRMKRIKAIRRSYRTMMEEA